MKAQEMIMSERKRNVRRICKLLNLTEKLKPRRRTVDNHMLCIKQYKVMHSALRLIQTNSTASKILKIKNLCVLQGLCSMVSYISVRPQNLISIFCPISFLGVEG